MFVYIGPYRSFIGPYQIADFLENFCVLERDRDAIGNWLSKTWVNTFSQWIDRTFGRTILIKAHRYDSWSADTTIAMMALPVLKQLRETKQGSGFVEDEDVPEELRSTNAPPKEHDYDTDENFHKRYEWVLNEVIWAFEQIVKDNDDQFWIEHPEIDFDAEGNHLVWKKEGKCDWEGRKAYYERIDNGTRLFGLYMRTFWN
jgi:hypothetical protein